MEAHRKIRLDPDGMATGESRVMRGDSWFDAIVGIPPDYRSASRTKLGNGHRGYSFGFRLAMENDDGSEQEDTVGS